MIVDRPAAYDVVILGAGAAGMLCAFTAGRRGRKVLLVDHASQPGEKIRISGGGRCNFTNLHCEPGCFLSTNPHFCISALRGYTQYDFIALVDRHGIAWHEKARGQLFCDGPSRQIIDLLVRECREAAVEFRLGTEVRELAARPGGGFEATLGAERLSCTSLVVATGGPSIPALGASDFAYRVARQFGLGVIAPRPGLVPLIFAPELRSALAGLRGVSVEAEVRCGSTRFTDALLFTHRGLSGPAILQISSYWQAPAVLDIDLAPGHDAGAVLLAAKRARPRQFALTVLAEILPRSLAQALVAEHPACAARLAECQDVALATLGAKVNRWQVRPAGDAGLRKAEVTVGGVDTAALDSRSMGARIVRGLHFIGEAVDVTGHLGGHNFQWAWSSGHAAGRAV